MWDEDGGMMEKRINKKTWFYWGRLSGFGLGFQISKYGLDINLGFWYLGWEY
jgi:hypothetical protein